MLSAKNKLFQKILLYLISLSYLVLFINYLNYLHKSIFYPYDWEATDGDHLNFSKRIDQGKSIYYAASQGHYLSVYNPLYHFVINYVGNGNQDLILAKEISAFFWILTVAIVAFASIKNLGVKIGLFLACIFAFPPIPNLVIEMLQIAPNSLLALTFLVSGFLYEKWVSSNYHINWFFPIILFTVITYFTKQQGLIVLIIIFICLNKNLKLKLSIHYLLTSIMAIILIGSYINMKNNHFFWASTLFDLNKILTSYWKLGIKRELEFMLYCSPIFMLSLYSAYSRIKINKQISFWETSILCHIPFLFFILRNGGGGQNYFTTMWISMMMTIILYLKKNKEFFIPFSNDIESIKKRMLKAKITLYLFLLYTLIFSLYMNFNFINIIKFPSNKIEYNQAKFYDQVRFYAPKNNCKALVYRNSFAFVVAGCDIDMEGATTFDYAWHYPKTFPKSYILEGISCKKYDLISNGISKFPSDISLLIESNYIKVYSSTVNLNYGNLGIQNIYIPNLKSTISDKCN